MKDAVTFSDLEGKIDVLRVECEKCGRSGRYSVANLVAKHGRDARMTDFRTYLTRDCPHKGGASIYNQCGAMFPDLAELWAAGYSRK